MKQREINEVFSHPTMGRLKVVEEGAVNECYGCVFNNPKVCLNDAERIHTGACAMEYRTDKKGVIFVKADDATELFKKYNK